MIKKLISFSIVMVAILCTAWGIVNRQYVRDWYIVQTTTPQPAAAALGDQLSLTSGAEFLYKASQTQILSSDQFNTACSNVTREQSIVLGCYTPSQHVYIYDVADTRLSGVKEVTAAHELLHAVYDRMSLSEKKRVNAEVQQAATAITDPRLAETIAEYKKTEPGEIDNELHSILGTEYAVLPQKLEAHYAKYFTNRSKIVAYSDAYQKQFSETKAQIKLYDEQLAQLKSQISSLESQISSLEIQLNNKQDELGSLRSTNVTAYNAQVPAFNALVARYNGLVSSVTKLTSQYNTIVTTRNSLSTNLNDLTKQLDSNYKTR